MHTLIRLMSEWVARRLEAGNARAAVVGAFLGVLAGIAGAYFFGDQLGHLRTGAFIFLPIVSAFAGAATGAGLPMSEPAAEAGARVRLNNLNRGLVPLFVFCVLAFAVPGVYLLPENRKAKQRTPRWPFAVGISAVALIAGGRIAGCVVG